MLDSHLKAGASLFKGKKGRALTKLWAYNAVESFGGVFGYNVRPREKAIANPFPEHPTMQQGEIHIDVR